MAKTLSSLPIGAKVKDPGSKYYGKDIIFLKIAENHLGYPKNSTTLLSEKIISLKASDAKEPNNSNSDRKSYGNNRYIHSNIKQWLNSSTSSWYKSQHSADEPPKGSGVSYNPYDTEKGFMANLTAELRSAILPTSLKVIKNPVDGGEVESFTDKIFLLSCTEVGFDNDTSYDEGAKFDYFKSNSDRVAYPTKEAIDNNTYTSDSLATNKGWYWWLRTPISSSSNPGGVRHVYSDGSRYNSSAYYGYRGVRPALNLDSGILVSDTPDSDGAYRLIHNRPPEIPSGITVPETIRSNSKVKISWTESTDPDGDSVGYRLERKTDNGSFRQVYEGTNKEYTDTILSSWDKVQYRVKAFDTYDLESGYRTSPEREIIHNMPPEISGQDTDLGTKTGPFAIKYTVTDEDMEEVKVQEKINGKTIKEFSVPLGKEQTSKIEGEAWLGLANGRHTHEIVATDAKGAVVSRRHTFTKKITKSTVTLEKPLPADEMITKTIVSVVRNIPVGAKFKVEICNNAYDSNPTWEDVTQNVEMGSKFFFSNESNTAGKWGYNFRIEIERGTVDPKEEIYIRSIGGNFE